MCAVILLFAFTMSLIIDAVEKVIARQNDGLAQENDPEEVLVPKTD